MFRAIGLSNKSALGMLRRGWMLGVVAWAPFVLLALLEGRKSPGWSPLLTGLEEYVRWLLAVPLLFLAEPLVDKRADDAPRFLRQAGIIPPHEQERLAAIEAAIRSVSGSLALEAILLGLAVAVSAAWHGPIEGLAAWWHQLVAISLYRFLVLRWLHRWMLWTWFLVQVSRLDLRLVGIHPDRAGGLGLLAEPSEAFAIVVLSLGCVFSSNIGRHLLAGASPNHFTVPVIAYVTIGIALAILPMLVFVPKLVRLREDILYWYGVMGAGYAQAFEARWRGQPGGAALGSSDIQSLNDLIGSFRSMVELQRVPFSKTLLLEISTAALLPLVPLPLLFIPINELAARLIRDVF